MIEQTEGQVTWSDLGLWSGKMCPELSAATKGKTSRQSSKRSSASQSRKPPILKCLKKAGQLGGATTMRWEDDGAWLGEWRDSKGKLRKPSDSPRYKALGNSIALPFWDSWQSVSVRNIFAMLRWAVYLTVSAAFRWCSSGTTARELRAGQARSRNFLSP